MGDATLRSTKNAWQDGCGRFQIWHLIGSFLFDYFFVIQDNKVWLFWSKKKGTHHTSTLIPMIIFIKNISKLEWKQCVTYCDMSAPHPCFFVLFFFVTCVSSCKSPFITNFENTPHTTQAQQITVSSPAVRRHTEYSHQGSAPQGRGYYTQRQNRMQMPNRRTWNLR